MKRYRLKRSHKYSAKRTVFDGLLFDSKMEAEYYKLLLILERAKELKILELQPKVYLTKANILYKPDFLIEQNNEQIWIDVKGFHTPVFKLKKKLWKYYGPGKLQLIDKTRNGFEVSEEIIPDTI